MYLLWQEQIVCVGVQTDGAKHTSDTKGKVSVIKRIIYVTLYLGYYLVHT